MKGMRKISRGSGFRGGLEYLCEEGKAQIIGGNMSGSTARALATEFGIGRSMRPEVEKPVWHNALRLPEGEEISPEKWREIGDQYMQKMGFTQRHQRVMFLERLPEGHHIHILANRISLDGQLYLGRNENLESTKHIQELEKQSGLKITKSRDELHPTQRPERSKPKKGEVEKALREGQKPSRLILQSILDQAMEGRPTTTEFFSRLELEGVLVIPNSASTGKVSGLAYSYEGILWKGSDLGKKYAWNTLIAGGIDYEQVRDASVIARKKAQAIIGNDRGNIDDIEPDRRTVPGDDKSRTGTKCHIESRNNNVTTTEPSGIAARGDSEGNSTHSGEVTRKRNGAEFSVEESGNRRVNNAKASGSDEGGSRLVRGSSKTDQASRNIQNTSDLNNRILHSNINCSVHSRNQAGNETTNCSGQQSSGRANRSQLATNSIGVVNAIKWQLTAWADFQKHLCSKLFRICKVDRDEKRTHPEKHGGKDGRGASGTPFPIKGIQTESTKKRDGEYLWSEEEVATDIASGRFNKWNYNLRMDMYVRPFDPKFHFIFIDDVKGRAGVREILREGYLPALVQESSHENFQVILRVRGEGMCESHTIERIASNKQALSLNRKHGDPGAGRAVQNFRLPGFINQKKDRDGFRVGINYEFSSPGAVCEKASNELAAWRDFVQSERFEVEQKGKQARFEKELLKLENSASTPDIKKFAALSRKWAAIKGKGGAAINLSEVDFQVAKELLQIDKWGAERIGEVMLAASPELEERKKTWTHGYISKTVAAAQKALIKTCPEHAEMPASFPDSQDLLASSRLDFPSFGK